MRMDEVRIEVGQPLGEKSSRRAGVSHQKCLVLPIGATFQKDRTGIVAALAGFPAIEVPAGFSTPTADAPIGVPVGMELLGRAWAGARVDKARFRF